MFISVYILCSWKLLPNVLSAFPEFVRSYYIPFFFSPSLSERSPYMTETLLTGILSLNSINLSSPSSGSQNTPSCMTEYEPRHVISNNVAF